jgi:hypothetical protein
MPLTDFQRALLAVLAPARAPDSYLAGGAALHFAPHSIRYSHDLDFFHDAAERVAEAFAGDRDRLLEAGYDVAPTLSQPGFVRAIVRRGEHATQVDWAHDSAWRFMPVVEDPVGGYLLHPVDLALNKVLALAGRDEVRDYVDIHWVMEQVLPLGPLVWATVGKDPGFTPLSLLEQLKRRGRPHAEDIARLDLARPFDLVQAKERWLASLEQAEAFVGSRPVDEVGCLYFSQASGHFEAPRPGIDLETQGLVPHFGRPGGILPRPADVSVRPDEEGVGPL